MQRTIPAVVAALLVVSTLAVVPAALAQQTATDESSSQNGSAAPGEQLSGAVGVHGAELDGEVESRAYGIRLAQANTDDARAGVVAEQLNTTEQRLAELETAQATLEEARANGSISESEYRVRAATLYAEGQNAQRLASQTNETASELPAETLEANGVNVTALRSLQDRAANLSGPEVAEIARTIAGPNAGMGVGPGANVTERSGQAGDRAGSSVDFGTPEATNTANTTAANETATDASETAPADT